MKKISIFTLSITLVFIISSTIFAQVVPKFGIKGGVNFSNFAQTEIEDYETKAGFVLGAFLELGIPMFSVSIQPEILYAQFGAGIKDADATVDLNYIQIPVLLKINFDAPGATPNIYFGPYANFLASAEVDGDGGSVEIDEIIEDSAFGVIIGGGIDLSKVQLGIRISAGITEVFKEDFSDDETNFGVALTVGLKL
ncbi:MAG: porin family protein [Balneola sp.]